MSLPGQQAGAVPGTVQQPAGGVPGAQATAVPGVVPGAAAPGAVPGAQAGTAGAQQPNKYSFFNRAPQDPALRFQGEGQSYRAKLIGIDPVPNSRGDKMCQEVILKQKSVVLASGLHKQRIIVNVSLNGIKLLDDDSKMVQFVHPVEKISFISRDTTDRRAFGYIVEGEKNKFHFFGIKTGNAAEGLVLALRDLFQVVYDIKQKEKNGGKQQDNKQQMENLQQGIEALNVDIGGGEQSDNFTSDSASIYSDYSFTGSVISLRQKSGLKKMKSKFSSKFNKGMLKISRNRMSMTSLDRISPMCFDGPNGLSELEKENSEPYTPPPYNERAVDPDRYHVESGAYNERCVDPELETDPKRIEKYRKTASTAHRESFAARRNSKRRISRTHIRSEFTSINRVSNSSSDLETSLENGLRISDSSEEEDSFLGNSDNLSTVDSEVRTLCPSEYERKSFISFGSGDRTPRRIPSHDGDLHPAEGETQISFMRNRPSLNSSIYSSARSKASEASSTTSSGSFSKLRHSFSRSNRDRGSREKRMGKIWNDDATPMTPTRGGDGDSESGCHGSDDIWNVSEETEPSSSQTFDVDWSVFGSVGVSHVGAALAPDDQSIGSSTLPPPSELDFQSEQPSDDSLTQLSQPFHDPKQNDSRRGSKTIVPIDIPTDEFTDVPDSVFGSLPSTPTDVTSLWDDLPADANEAFKDFPADSSTDFFPRPPTSIKPVSEASYATTGILNDRVNNYDDRILEESEFTVTKIIEKDGVRETFIHKFEWSEELMLFPEASSHVDPGGEFKTGDLSIKDEVESEEPSLELDLEPITAETVKSLKTTIEVLPQQSNNISPNEPIKDPISDEQLKPPRPPSINLIQGNKISDDHSRHSSRKNSSSSSNNEEYVNVISEKLNQERKILDSASSELALISPQKPSISSVQSSTSMTSSSLPPFLTSSLIASDVTSSTEISNSSNQPSKLQNYFSPFLNPAIGPISSTETLNSKETNHSGASTVKSSSSSTCSSPTPLDHIYDDCPYDTAYTTDSESVIPKSEFSPALSVSRRIVLESNERIAPPTPQRPRIAPLRLQRKTPPPIPPRLNELKPLKTSKSLVAAPETATGATEVPAVAAASGGDDLGFLDVQVSSAQEIVEQQSQQNKMANIMGAFGSNPAAAPMPGMGGQNAFGSAANNMGMQQPAMVNSVSNNMMGQMSSMPSMGGAPPMGGAQVGGMMGGMGGIGGMGGMGGMAPPAQMGGMTAPTQAMSTPTMSATPAMSPMSPMSGAPSSSGSNTANAMGGKSDPFASLGALTGIAPKAAPTPQMSMNQQQQQQNNQFNQYMNNNVGAPASTGGNSMDALFG